jgi:hypothetical protein
VTDSRPLRVGELRPSQLLWSYGVGALVDLPHLAVIVRGLNDWNPEHSVPLTEERLLASVRKVLGSQVQRLLSVPIDPHSDGPYDPFGPYALIGVPVSPFPEWLRCPFCGLLAPIESGLFALQPNLFRPDRVKYVHENCNKAHSPDAVPARFLVACRDGHLDDFPWRYFVHGGAAGCNGQLRFFEQGASLETANLWVRCTSCEASRSMIHAFDPEARALPGCRGRHPHLGEVTDGCDQPLRTILLGASNGWFPVTMSVLSVPTHASQLSQLVEDNWGVLTEVPSSETLRALRRLGHLREFAGYTDDEIMDAIGSKRARDEGAESAESQEVDLKGPEWEAFSNPDPELQGRDFMLETVEVPSGYEGILSRVVLAHRLREVNVLIGFTRVEPPDEPRSGEEGPERAPLASGAPTWVPASEVKGEGVFLAFESECLSNWLGRRSVRQRAAALLEGHERWRAARRLSPDAAGFPGVLLTMLHSLSHALIREFAVECGYGAASIRERIYASPHGEGAGTAGIMLYTAAPDSEGTLGGLVELGRPSNLGRLLDQALERARLCSSDPLCAEHRPGTDRSLHGAACHACLFAAETSCELGNRYLDRALIVPTLRVLDAAIFSR